MQNVFDFLLWPGVRWFEFFFCTPSASSKIITIFEYLSYIICHRLFYVQVEASTHVVLCSLPMKIYHMYFLCLLHLLTDSHLLRIVGCRSVLPMSMILLSILVNDLLFTSYCKKTQYMISSLGIGVFNLQLMCHCVYPNALLDHLFHNS